MAKKKAKKKKKAPAKKLIGKAGVGRTKNMTNAVARSAVLSELGFKNKPKARKKK